MKFFQSKINKDLKESRWVHYHNDIIFFFITADPEGPGFCAFVLTCFAAMLLMITLPFSLCTCIKVRFYKVDLNPYKLYEILQQYILS